jgi:hypothetical protein
MAQQLIRELPAGVLDREDVAIEAINDMSGSHAVVDARVRTAFRVEKVQGKWVVKEIRLGKGPWQSLDSLVRALETIRHEETRALLDRIGGALEKYVAARGALPEFSEYVGLSNALHPEFLTPLVREDAWRRPLAAYRTGGQTVRLVSPGADGKLGSSDDVELTRSYPTRKSADK